MTPAALPRPDFNIHRGHPRAIKNRVQLVDHDRLCTAATLL